MTMRDGFERLVEHYLENNPQAKDTINGFLFHYKFPPLSHTEAAYLVDELSSMSTPEMIASLTLEGSLRQAGRGYHASDAKAIEHYDLAIAWGDSLAMSNRANMYRQGRGEEQNKPNYSAAITLYDRAILSAESDAMCNRASMYQYGLGDTAPNYPEAIALYDKAIELNHTIAMCNRAEMYRRGQGEIDRKPNFLAAVDLYQKAIALGSPLAIRSLADMYRWGEEGSCDYSAAIPLYEKAIELGDARSMCHRAMMYELGLGSLVNDLRAAQLYKQAIAFGDTSAKLRRHRMEEDFLLKKIPSSDLDKAREPLIKPIRNGFKRLVESCLNDNPKARDTLHKLLTQDILPGLTEEELGYLISQLPLLSVETNTPALVLNGLLHQLGRGLPLSYPDAIRLYEQAIALNDAFAMGNRAYMYLWGQGEEDGKPNEEAAIALFQRAISLGNTFSMCMLAANRWSTSPKRDTDSDYILTSALYDEAIDLGDTWAMRARAERYKQGVGEIHHKPDYLAAMILYQKASALHDAEAIYAWAEMCQSTLNNLPAATALYAWASTLGHRPAQVKLIEIERDDMARTEDKSVKRSAEQRHASEIYHFFATMDEEFTSESKAEKDEEGADTPKAFV